VVFILNAPAVPAPFRDAAQGLSASDENFVRVQSEPLSPELALVDPELAARARAALPDRVATSPRPPAPPAQRPAVARQPAPARRPSPERTRYPLWARLVAMLWILVIGILIGGAGIPHAQDRPRVVPASEDVICEPPQPTTTRPALPMRPLAPTRP
jgi:hypothetical protein